MIVTIFFRTRKTCSPALRVYGSAAQLIYVNRAHPLKRTHLVFNHNSDEAEHAKAGDEKIMDFYRIFPNRQMPDHYEQNLREIFPEENTGIYNNTSL